MVLPFCAAAKADGKPAAPTMAHITPSTSPADATSIKACRPDKTSVGHPSAVRIAFKSAAADSSATTAKSGRNCMHCRANLAVCLWPARANMRNRSGWRATTSKVFTPMLPVLPKTVRTCILITQRYYIYAVLYLLKAV